MTGVRVCCAHERAVVIYKVETETDPCPLCVLTKERSEAIQQAHQQFERQIDEHLLKER